MRAGGFRPLVKCATMVSWVRIEMMPASCDVCIANNARRL